jgi:predicted Zn-dependent protease
MPWPLGHRPALPLEIPVKRSLALLALPALLAACPVSQKHEVRMGTQYAQKVNAELPIIADPEINRYINVIGDSIAKLTRRGDLDWHFYVVDSREVNAFALPGGFVYVNRGLIERADRMDELAGVLGHEIGHVVERHSVKEMQKAQAANVGMVLACVLTRVCSNPVTDIAMGVGGEAIFAKFSREDESHADEEGFTNVVRAGISPEGMLSMFQKLLEERNKKPIFVEAWFTSHPLEEDRIEEIQAQINAMDPAVLASLTTDSPNFHSFKDRLQSLPQAPMPPHS